MVKPAASQRTLLIGAAALAFAVPPLLLRAEPENSDAVRDKVARMSKTERDRLERNSREYLQLSEEQRAQYRQLHAVVSDDAADGRGTYQQAMEDYYAWLAHHQLHRQELRNATDAAQRIEIIERLIEEQSRDLSSIRNPFLRYRFRRTPVLSSDELAMVMAVVEEQIDLSAEERQRLQQRQGVVRYLELFRVLRSRRLNLHELIAGWDIEALLARFPEVRLPEPGMDDPAGERRRQFVELVIANVLKEFELERSKAAPTEAQLREFVENWPPAEQAELNKLLEMEPAEFRRQLERRWYAAENRGLDFEALLFVLGSERRRGSDGRGPRGRERFGSSPPREPGENRGDARLRDLPPEGPDSRPYRPLPGPEEEPPVRRAPPGFPPPP